MKAGDIVVSRMTEHQSWGTAIYCGEYKIQGFVWHDVRIIGMSHKEMHEYCVPLNEETWKLIGTKNTI